MRTIGCVNTLSAFAIFLLSSTVAKAQVAPDNSIPPAGSAVNLPTTVNYIPNSMASTTIIVILFGVICLLIQAALLWRSRASSDEVLKNTTVTLVVTLGICALTIGYNQQQIAPITGLFGTIIGFLLGQSTSYGRAETLIAGGKSRSDNQGSDKVDDKSETEKPADK
jgi:hypothetical protein